MRYRASDVMKREVVSVRSDMDLRDLAKLFLTRGITGAPVVDDQQNLVGVISHKDLVFYNLTRDDELVLDSDFYHHVRVEGHPLPKGYQIEDTNTGRVDDVMTPVVHAVSERVSLEAVARMMIREHIHRVIVRRGTKVVGIISALDLLKLLGAQAVPAAKRRAAKGSTATPRPAARASRSQRSTPPRRSRKRRNASS